MYIYQFIFKHHCFYEYLISHTYHFPTTQLASIFTNDGIKRKRTLLYKATYVNNQAFARFIYRQITKFAWKYIGSKEGS